MIVINHTRVFAPDRPLLEMVVNGTVGTDLSAVIGDLRATECQFGAGSGGPEILVRVSMRDFAGRRTAMFGKTRLGKSNVVKLLAQGMIDATPATVTMADGRDVTLTVGQLIFDLNGEYANDNPQDGSRSIRSANASRCDVYALTARPATPSRPLRLNFYEQPDSCMGVADLLSRAVFGHQEAKFVSDGLGGHFVQLYFEEAHNLFRANDRDLTGPYARFAKEGAKFHVGMVYSTQSPSTINRDLLAQTENFFVGHLSSEDEARASRGRRGRSPGLRPTSCEHGRRGTCAC